MGENEFQDVDEQLQRDPRTPRKESAGLPWGAALLLVWAVLLIIFSVQNADATTVSFLAWSWDMPIALLVLVTALVTLVITGIGFAVYRRRRRKRREMRRAPSPED